MLGLLKLSLQKAYKSAPFATAGYGQVEKPTMPNIYFFYLHLLNPASSILFHILQ